MAGSNASLCYLAPSTTQQQPHAPSNVVELQQKKKTAYLNNLVSLVFVFADRFPIYQRYLQPRDIQDDDQHKRAVKRYRARCSVIAYIDNETGCDWGVLGEREDLPENDEYLPALASTWYQQKKSVDRLWVYMWESVSRVSLRNQFKKLKFFAQHEQDLKRGGLRRILLRRNHYKKQVREQSHEGDSPEIIKIPGRYSWSAPTRSFRRLPLEWGWCPSKLNPHRRDRYGKPIVGKDSSWKDENGRLIEGRGSIDRILNVSKKRLSFTPSF